MTLLNRARAFLSRSWAPRPAGPGLTVLAYAAAITFFVTATLALGLAVTLLLLGLHHLGTGWAILGAVFATTMWLGFLCLPSTRGPATFRPGRHRRKLHPSAEADVSLYDEVQRDDLTAYFERLYDADAFRPPHDYRVRPAAPPRRGRDRADTGGDHG